MNSFLAMLKYDIRNGIGKQKFAFLFAILLNVVPLVTYSNMNSELKYSPFDCLAYLFEGIYPYNPNADSGFSVPIVWFAAVLLPAFIIGNYATNDLSGYGSHIILKSKNKTVWFVSKMLWCFIAVTIYFAALIGLSCIFAYIFGGNMDISLDKWRFANGNFWTISDKKIILYTIVMPFTTIVTCSIVQLAISLITSSQTAYMVIIVYYVLSAYFTTPFLVGNHSMLNKNEYVSMNSGINFAGQWKVCVVMIVVAIAASYIVVKKRDLHKVCVKY